MKYLLKDRPAIFVILILLTISIHIFATILLFSLEIPFYQQLSFEILNVFLFISILIIIKYSINIWASILVVVFAGIVASVEIFNITIKETYTYTGFRLLLVSHDSTTNLPSGGYPLVIPFGWIVCLLASYSLTNLIFKNENKNNLNISRICLRIVSDGLITGTYAMFLEATGNSLNWWIYSSWVPDDFFGVPVATLYYYILFSLFFSTIIRFGIYFNKKIFQNNDNPIAFTKLKWFSNFIPLMFIYSWLYTLILSIGQYGIYNWNILVSAFPLIFYSILLINDFFVKIEDEFSKEKKIVTKIQLFSQISGIILYICVIIFLLISLRVFENVIYMLVIVVILIFLLIVFTMQRIHSN